MFKGAEAAAKQLGIKVFLTTNNEAGGNEAAVAIAACIKERTGKAAGKVGYLTAMAGHELLDSRDKGFVEGMKAYPDIKVVGNRAANNEEAEGMIDLSVGSVVAFCGVLFGQLCSHGFGPSCP